MLGVNWKVTELSLLFLGQLAYRLPHPTLPPPQFPTMFST